MAKIDLKEILREVLIANNIPEQDYSLNGYKEGAVCIEGEENGYEEFLLKKLQNHGLTEEENMANSTQKYIVYNGKKNQKYNVEYHERLLFACFDIISRVTTVDNCEYIKQEFIESGKYKKYTNLLVKIMKSENISESCYSIGEYKEGAVCLERTLSGYEVYYARAGQKENIKKYDVLLNAISDMISRIVKNEKDSRALIVHLMQSIVADLFL